MEHLLDAYSPAEMAHRVLKVGVAKAKLPVADSLILALGQNSDASLLNGIQGIEFEWDTVIVDEHMMTGHPGIFAGGDMVPSERTVTVAVGHGKKAARNIDAWLRGEVYIPPAKNPLASFDKLHDEQSGKLFRH